MSDNNNAPPLVLCPINPFCYYVSSSGGSTVTLMDIAYDKVRVPLSDLRALNSSLKDTPANEPLPDGTMVHLPVVAHRRGAAWGPYFNLGEEEARIKTIGSRLDRLAASQPLSEVAAMPQRRVRSKTEQVLAAVESEAARQLPDVEKKLATTQSNRLLYLVDVDPVRAKEKEVEEQFQAVPAAAALSSYGRDSAHLFEAPPKYIADSYLSASTVCPKADSDEDFCMAHTHRWEFMFCGSHSAQEQEVWAVLSCQRLTALLDAFTCSNTLPLGPLRNAFFFIGGKFYIDDRHKDEPDYEDLSEVIRLSDPAAMEDEMLRADADGEDSGRQARATPVGVNAGFGGCPVLSAASTTFADLHIKQGELCVLRHLNNCTHYFYLQGPRSLRGYPRQQRCDFPHRTMKRRDHVLRCHLCRMFPSTVALYNDELSPRNPTVYCTICLELLHGGESEEDSRKYLKVFPDEAVGYFKY